MGVWAGSLINLLCSTGPSGLNAKNAKQNAKNAKQNAKNAKTHEQNAKTHDQNAKNAKKNAKTHEQNAKQNAKTHTPREPNLCKQNSIVATLFRSKIICTVRIRIGSFVLRSFQLKCSSNIDSIHYLRLTYSFHQVPRDIHTLPVKEPIPSI
jgi:hypothetical protein